MMALLSPLAVGAAPRQPVIVAIHVTPAAGGSPELATGVAAGPGRVVTVAHVLDVPGALSVVGPDGVARRATVARTDRRLDLAVLAVPGLEAPRLQVGEPTAGARLLLRRDGRVDSRDSPVRRRILAHLVDEPGAPWRPALELAADVRRGDSGAPLVTPGGRLAGIVYARSDVRPRTVYAVRGTALAALLSPDAARAARAARRPAPAGGRRTGPGARGSGRAPCAACPRRP